ncbi:hypothetical protein ASF98_00135 [Arthrobacter sp. Leaf337]|uniref:hypothetical protein n=1 Tax=Arthrobacter sp. Leaf337 TaxID=1736342 RepID=UPI0006FAF3AD|nr:hypothetical protein [Arthrobacter sp. Leaf337]KQR82471.1 hypothetical protein ASF98_00135 [Arthrobacter sp. Leaf337]
MGTSADRSAGTGGDWTPLKLATTTYVRGLGNGGSKDRAGRVLGRHVPLLGGTHGAASSARAGTAGISRLGGLLAGLGTGQAGEAFTSLGLGHLVGQDRFTVLDELVTYIAGTGDDLDSVAARDAACDVLDEVFGDADSWEELDDVSVGREQLGTVLERFLALYVYNRVPVVAERLSRMTDPAAMRQADQEMRHIIADLVAIHLPSDPFNIDWRGPEGRSIAERAVTSTYELLTELDSEARA